jgi:hypothetical protein
MGPVDSEQHGRPGDPLPVEQLADRGVGGHPAGALLAADVHGELRRLVQALGEDDLADLPGQQPSALKRDQPALAGGE